MGLRLRQINDLPLEIHPVGCRDVLELWYFFHDSMPILGVSRENISYKRRKREEKILRFHIIFQFFSFFKKNLARKYLLLFQITAKTYLFAVRNEGCFHLFYLHQNVLIYCRCYFNLAILEELEFWGGRKLRKSILIGNDFALKMIVVL